MNMINENQEEKYFSELVEIFKLLSDQNRLKILSMLRKRELCVCEIVDRLETTQPNVSQHMRKLKIGGIVSERKQGQWVYYSLNANNTKYLKAFLDSLPEFIETSNGGAIC